MGSQCGRCLTRESEMLAEILLGNTQKHEEMFRIQIVLLKQLKKNYQLILTTIQIIN
jgi:hypothetical protein